MNPSLACLIGLSILGGAPDGGAQVVYSEGFDSEASAKLKAVEDFDTEIVYVDYSSFSVEGTAQSIAEAPNQIAGSAATHGVLMRANIFDGIATGAVLLAADGPGGSPVTFTGSYKLTFDMYISLADPIPGGSTEFGVWGVGTGEDFYGWTYRDNGLVGTWGYLSSDSDSGSTAGDASVIVGDFLNGELATLNNPTTGDFLPEFSEAFPDAAPREASANNQWTEAEITVADGRVTVKFNGVVFFSDFVSSQTDGFVLIGYEDPFRSLSTDPAFAWGLFDNMVVEEISEPTVRIEQTSDDPVTNVPDTQLPILYSVQNLSENELTVSEVNFINDSDDGFSLATALPVVVPANSAADIEILFTATGEFGGRSATVEFVSDDPQEPRIELRADATFLPVLLGHYKFDEADGITAADSGPLGDDGVYQVRDDIEFGIEPPLAAGTSIRLAEAAETTTGNFVTAPVEHTPTMSTSIWVRPESVGFSEEVIVNRNPAFSATDIFYGLVISDFGALLFNVANIPVLETDEGTIVEGEVYHIVITHLDEDGFGNDTATRTRMYINGSLVVEATGDEAEGYDDYPAGTGSGLRALYIGSRTGADVGGYNGLMDDLQVYSTELTADEVASLFANPGSTVVDGAVSAPPFAITEITRDSITGLVTLTWNSRAGVSYIVEFSDDGMAPWNEAVDGVAGGAGSTTVTLDANQSGMGKRFFRVVEE